MLTHLVIALIGSGIFLRMVAKEKNRRERHLLLRLAQQEQRLAEAEAASQPQPDVGDSAPPPLPSEPPVEAQVVGQAA